MCMFPWPLDEGAAARRLNPPRRTKSCTIWQALRSGPRTWPGTGRAIHQGALQQAPYSTESSSPHHTCECMALPQQHGESGPPNRPPRDSSRMGSQRFPWVPPGAFLLSEGTRPQGHELSVVLFTIGGVARSLGSDTRFFHHRGRANLLQRMPVAHCSPWKRGGRAMGVCRWRRLGQGGNGTGKLPVEFA